MSGVLPTYPFSNATLTSDVMRSVFESSADCIKMLDLDSRLLFMSAGGLCTMEIDDVGPLIGVDWTSFWTGPDADLARAAIAEAKAGRVGRFQGFCRSVKGTPKCWDVVVNPIRDADGAISGLLCISRDITELRSAQAEARDKAALLETTLNHMEQGLMLIGADHHVTICNQKALELLELPTELMEKRPHFDDIRRHQLATGEFTKTIGTVEALVRRGGFDPGPGSYERERPDGTILEIRTVRLPDGGAVRTYSDITERRRAEAELRASEARHRALIEASAAIVWRSTRDGSIIEGHGWDEYSGQFVDEYKGYGWIEVVHPDDRERLLAIWAESLKTGVPAPTEYRIRRTDGEYRWVQARGVPLKDADGEIYEWVGTLTDIHEHRVAEEALRGREETLRLAVAATGLGTWDHDIRSGERRWSSEMRAILGLAKDHPISHEIFLGCVHPDDRAWVQDLLGGTYAGTKGDHYEVEFRIIRVGEETERWIAASGQVFFGEDGKPRRALGTIQDITGRKQVEQALRDSGERHRLLADHATDMIIRADLSGRRVYVSPAAKHLLGYSPDELIGTQPQDFVHAEDRAHLVSAIDGMAKGHLDRATRTYRLRHRDGHWVWIEAKFQLRRDPRGKPLEVISASRDITERHRQGAELQAAKEAAEQASQAKTEFLAAMSHEIRTPLNGVLGHTDLLLDDQGLDAVQRRHVERIRTAGSALLTVVNDVLDFSRIEAGQVELEAQPFCVSALVDNAMSIVQSSAEQRGLVLSSEIDGALPKQLIGDQDRLRQVLLNLLNNAVKFTPAGRVTLTVESCGCIGARQGLRFAVADTGIGIPHDKQGRLFQHFSQVDSSIRRRFGGTGLGLAISKRLIDLMGGRIGVESTPGEGSTFWFEVALDQGDAQPRSESDPVPVMAGGRPARVLLVEDNEINQEIATAVLQAAGHEVDVAPDGSVGVMMVQARTYDVVLMDVQMPVMDGMTATRHIRSLASPVCDVPVIAMTANVLPQQVDAFLKAGMNDHIGKPFRRDKLLEAVQRYAQDEPAPTLPGKEGPGPDAFSRATFDALRTMVGPKADDWLAKFSEQLSSDSLAGPDPEERGHVARAAHVVVSTAGVLGFADLSAAARDLEQACLSGSDMKPPFARFSEARSQAIRILASLVTEPDQDRARLSA